MNFYSVSFAAGVVGLSVLPGAARADSAVYFYRANTTIEQKHADATRCADLAQKKMPNADSTNVDFITAVIQCMRSKKYSFGVFPECESKAVQKSLVPILRNKSRPPREGACVIQVTGRTGNLVYADEQ
ncbi:hypothetical protein [Ovoidimarina sediminis]|uniref:hypothetical protein n=1 Tax=Ovoidimarina sediminis TaxID=3079856 RepID=UPI00290FB052|nr:hypothetical protein [Rhodophyticola sp. MJ-SS7]MDU8943545.1 hypothetical protein [Rhodophyticola sp. MJ-SS7]